MIKDFSTAYWGYLPTTSKPYPAHPKVNAFIGASGHGKTTIMDGLRLILGDAKFENNRDASHYIHKISKWAVVRASFYNEPVNGIRPFESVGYQNDELTCCCLITLNTNGRPEKEYYVFDGVFNDIVDLGRNPKAYIQSQRSQKQYKQILEECLGVTPAFRNLMSMNPTTVKNLVHMNANDLFLKVFELKGIKQIHDNYKSSKDELGKQEVQLHQAQNTLNEGLEHFKSLQFKSEKFKEHQLNKLKLQSLKQKMLKVEFWENDMAIKNNEEKIKSLKNEINNEQDKKINLDVQRKAMKEELALIENKQSEYLSALSDLQKDIRDLGDKVGETKSDKKKIEEEILKLKSIKPLDKEKIILEHEEVLKILEEANDELRREKEKLSGLQKREKDLEQNKLYPDHVYHFTQLLDKNKITHILLADAISLKPEYIKWQIAVEAFLGNERFKIIVEKNQELEAKKLQETYGYTARVSLPKVEVETPSKKGVPYPTIRSVINVVSPEKVGGYLTRLNDIYLVETVEEGHKLQKQGLTSITLKGLQQDQDGSIFRKHNNLCCGRLALEKEKELIKDELLEQKRVLQEKELYAKEYESEVNRLKIIINEQNELENLPAKEKELNAIDEKLKALLSDRNDKETIYKEVSSQHEKLWETFSNKKRDDAVFEEQEKQCMKDIERLAKELKNVNETIQNKRQELDETKQQLISIGISLEDMKLISQEINIPDFKNEKGEIYSSKDLKKECDNISENISQFIRDNPDIDETVVELVKVQEALVNQLQERYNEIKEQRDRWEQECSDGLAALQSHIKETMRDFIEEFQMMADLIGANASGRLEPRGEDPDLWELYLSIGFDGKKPVLISSPDLSSGQRARTSLLVLLAAVSSKRRGEKLSIMFLDEPNAEVDDYSGNDIGQVFQVTDIQYFITHQIGESLKSIQWINHSFICSQCPPEEKFAKPLIVQKMRG